MSGVITIRRLITVAVLTAVWCGLWRDISIANLAAGAAIAIGLTASGLGTTGRGGIRPVPAIRLIWLVLVDLVRSTIGVAIEIVTPTDHTEESIIAVDLPPESRGHLLLLIVAITLTPGTAVVDADPATGTLYLHLLHHDRRHDTVAHVERLAGLANQALPTAPGLGVAP